MTSYPRPTVNMALSRVVSEIFNVEKILRPWNASQEPIKVIESGTIRYTGYGFLLVFYCNFVHNEIFWDIRLQICRDLDNRIRGP